VKPSSIAGVIPKPHAFTGLKDTVTDLIRCHSERSGIARLSGDSAKSRNLLFLTFGHSLSFHKYDLMREYRP